MKLLREQSLVVPAFLSFGLIGFLFSSVSVSLPLLSRLYGLRLDMVGLASAGVQLGYSFFCYIGGILSDLFGKRRVLSLGCCVYGVCGILHALPRSFGLNLVLFLGLGIGAGLIYTSSNTLVIRLFPQKRNSYMNIHHTVYALVSFSSPLINNALLRNGASWYSIYRAFGIAAVITGFFFFMTLVFDKKLFVKTTTEDIHPGKGAIGKYFKIFRNKGFLFLMFPNLLAVGSQFAIVYLFVLFLVEVKGVPENAARIGLAVYFIFIALGRFFCSRLVKRFSLSALNLFFMIALAVVQILGWLLPGTASLVLFALSGFAGSGLAPNMVSMTSRMLSDDVQGASVGVMAFGGGMGGLAATYGTTYIAAYTGLRAGYAWLIFCLLAPIALFMVFIKKFNYEKL